MSKMKVLPAAIMSVICIAFGFVLGWNGCAAVNDVDDLKTRLELSEDTVAQLNTQTHDSTVQVEEQLATTEQSIEELRKALNKLQQGLSKAASKGADAVEGAGKAIEKVTKEAKEAVGAAGTGESN